MTFVNVEALVCTYLDSLAPGNVAPEMDNTDPTPFVIVRRIAGGDDGVTDYAVVQIDFIHSSRSAAYELAAAGHKLMCNIQSAPIVLGGRGVRVDRILHDRAPAWMDYQDENLRRFVARYQIETRVTAV